MTVSPQSEGGKLRRTKSDEDFAMTFGNGALSVSGPDESGQIGSSEYDDLADFSEYWENSGNLPPKTPTNLKHQSATETSPLPMPARSMLSGATSPTENGTDSGTQASESWTGTAGDDHISTLSNDTDDCDTASRSSVKRRRTAGATSSASSLGFQPLGPLKEGAAAENNESDVRPWRIDIPAHDVVLGDTHEPTYGTKLYREVRKPYAKKTITNEQLKTIKIEFQRRLEQELGRKLNAPPVFWYKKEDKTKTKPIPVSGFLKNRPGITYAYAKDQAIKDDVKNASARSRTRATKHFTLKGPLDQVIDKAIETCDAWVGEDIDKELFAKGFKEDLERMVPWRAEYIRKKDISEEKAESEAVMRGTHKREARIHEAHASHLEIAMVDMINQLGNMMIEAYRAESKKMKAADVASVGGSAGTSSKHSKHSKSRSSETGSRRHSAIEKQKSMPSLVSKDGAKKKKKSPSRDKESKTAFKPIDDDIAEMDISPIDVRKESLSSKLQADQAKTSSGERKDLSSLFSQNLRMSSLEDLGNPYDHELHIPMPHGVPREVRPDAADELSVISAPDDMSLAFMEARESAIRRGLDQPAALPQSGHVADRTKALLQQMKSQKDSK